MSTIIIIIGLLIAFVLITAILIGNKMEIERSVSINKPLDHVFDYLKFVRNQDNFSVWNMQDPDMKKDFRGTDGTEGFVYGWNSKNKNVGAGEQEIKSIVKGENIDYEIRFFRPMANVAKASFVFKPVTADQTVVQWGFYSKMKLPMNIMKPIFQRMLGKDLAKSLENLRVILEKQ